MSPGPRYWPAPQAGDATVRKLLPVLDPRPVAVDPAAADPAHPSLSPGVALAPSRSSLADPNAWPMLQLAAGPEPSRGVWDGPASAPLGPRRPGQAGGDRPGDAPGHLRSRSSPRRPYGLGRVLWVGTDGTWRWRHRVGDAYHHRFWGQAVRWASSGRLAAGDANVRFGPVRPQVAEGEGARIQARVAASLTGLAPDLLVAARVFRGGLRPGRGRRGRPAPPGRGPAPPLRGHRPPLPARLVPDPARRAATRRGPPPPPSLRRRPSRPPSKSPRATPPSASSSPPPATPSTASPAPPAAASSPTTRPTSSPPAPRPDPRDRPDRADPALGRAGRLAPVLRHPHRRVGRAEAGGTPLKPSREAGAIFLLPAGEGGRDGRMRVTGPTMSHVLRRGRCRKPRPLIRPFGAPSPGGRR